MSNHQSANCVANERYRFDFSNASDLSRFKKRVEAAVRALGLQSEFEDIYQGVLTRMLAGRNQHSTIAQAVIDYLRTISGRKGHGGYNPIKGSNTTEWYAEAFVESSSSWHVSSGHFDGHLGYGKNFNRLMQFVTNRTDREIAYLYYVWGFLETEIADHYSVSVSRICQRLKRVQSCVSKGIAETQSGHGRKAKKGLANILCCERFFMEPAEIERMAFKEPGTMESLDGQGFAEWLT